MEDSQKIEQLEHKVELLEAIIASLASIELMDQDDKISLKINEILSKFNVK